VLTPQQNEEWRQVLLTGEPEVEGRIGRGLLTQVDAPTGFGAAKRVAPPREEAVIRVSPG